MRQMHARRGFTLVELLVVIAIIGILMALLIPAVNAARARARLATCLNNLKEIGKGIIAYDSTKQQLPGYLQPLKRVDSSAGVGFLQPVLDPQNGITGASFATLTGNIRPNVMPGISWAAAILPNIDRNDLWDALQSGPSVPIGKVDLYVCPDDSELAVRANAAGLTYVVNTGAWDRDANGNFVGDTLANGMFHNLALGGTKSSITDVNDGSSTTIMVSENVHKDYNSQQWTCSWLGATADKGGEQQFGMVWVVANPPAGPPTSPCVKLPDQARLGLDPGTASFPADQPCYARPGTNHIADQVNVIMADGSGRGLVMSQMDYLVYQQLMSPYNRKCTDPSGAVAPNQEPILTFQQSAPLSTDDIK